MTRDKIGIVIGRFQVDNLHDGHVRLINHVLEEHTPQRTLLLVGCNRSHTYYANRDSALPFAAQKAMLKQIAPGATILPVVNCRTNEEWSRKVDEAVDIAFPGFKGILYGGRDSCLDSYSGVHQKRPLDFGKTHSGTDRRNQIINEPDFDDPKFRAGIIFALGNLGPRTFRAVDIAMTRQRPGTGARGIDNIEVLLGHKEGEPGWRFPGGFVEAPRDTSDAAAAARELHEETQIAVEREELHYVTSAVIDDWRTRGANDLCIMTSLFHVEYSWGAAVGSDDLREVKWMTWACARQYIVPEHRVLVEALEHHLEKEFNATTAPTS